MAASRLLIEYDGSGFAGWACQPGKRTVQAELEAALAQLRGGEPTRLTVAGRTDAGVHALGQVASYAGDPVAAHNLNGVLARDIVVHSCEAAPEGFSARYDATWRAYRYRLLCRRARSPFEEGRALFWPHTLDVEALHACAALVPGVHDFTAFTPTETSHRLFEREVHAAGWSREGDILSFDIRAQSFMRNMNRILVGTMLEVAGGRRTIESFAALLKGAHRRDAGPTAPAHGLYLVAVGYE